MIAVDLFPETLDPFKRTAQFDDKIIGAVEKRLSRKNDKVYVECLVRKKEVAAKPEEIIRQLWLQMLVDRFKYPTSRLQVEYPITFGRDTSKRADIVIFDADRPTVPYVIIEVKQATAKGGKEQLKSYTHATGAPLAIWSDGITAIVWHRKNPNYFEEIPALPKATETIEQVAGQPWTIDTLIDYEKQRDLEGSKGRSLRQLIEDLEDEVLANAGVDVFEEVFKLIFTKLYDELSCYSEFSTHLRFRNVNTAAQTKKAIQDLFDEACAKWEGVFPADDKIRLTPEHLQVCVGSLEKWKLFNSNLDVVDEAFEYLVNKSSKGEKGQYFTPRWVIDLCVRMLNPKEDETIIDTACGSAGFTVHSIFHVWKQILADLGKPASHLFTMEKKPARCTKYVQEKVFAIDFDEKSVRVSRCLNLIAGDGQTNVLHLNTLDFKRWEETTKQPDWIDIYNEGWKKLRKLMAEKNDYRGFQFDVLMANPPFAGDVKQTDMLSPYELAHKIAKDGGQGKLESAVGRDLLFIERNLDFLKPGGRMAVVLPQGRFNNSSDQRVREFIAERCRILAVVGIHGNTFKPHTGTKTSVLFVQKWNDDKEAGPLCKKVADYPIFFATQRLPSKDNSGDKIYSQKEMVRFHDWQKPPGDPDRLVELTHVDFVKKFGEPLAASKYQVIFPDGTQGVFRGDEEVRDGLKPLQLRGVKGFEVNWLKHAEEYKERLRDTHGHWVVQHDFFNHDSLTQDGIAEAFEEFAAKEKLSFF
jgi:type I restriction enzyme M protein